MHYAAFYVVDPPFFAWVCGFGKGVKVIGSASVTGKMDNNSTAIAEANAI